MGKLKGQSKKKQSLVANQSQITQKPPDKKIAFNFSQIDMNQGERFEDWINEGLIKDLIDKLIHYSDRTIDKAIVEQSGKKFKIYEALPKEARFKHPPCVPPDARWACIHIQQKPCLIGHVVENIFYIVFLDKNHRFYPTEKKGTH